jgi:hypothetical protein
MVVDNFVRKWSQDLNKYETEKQVENGQFFFIWG